MAATYNRLKIHKVIEITPFSDSTSAFTLPLTCFDTFWFKFPPAERLFFYQINDLTSDLFNSVILPKLKHSLSLTLLHYLPLAGNIMWPEDAAKPAIYYSPNDSVSVTVAESGDDFNHLSGNGIREAIEFHPLNPQLSISDNKAEVIAIQITLFPNEGFTIGITSHHAVLDGKSSTMFMKSWACLCKQLVKEENPSLLPELTPFFDRTVIEDPRGLDLVYANHWQLAFAGSANSRSLKVLPVTKANSNLVRATFELTRECIKKLRDKVIQNEETKLKELHLSTFVLTCAYVFTCIVKAKGEEGNKNVLVGLPVDLRSRLDPPIPTNYFGNCVGAVGVAIKVSDFMHEHGVAFVAEKLSDLIKGIGDDVIKGSEEKIVKLMAWLKQKELRLAVAGSTRFNVYGSDFGWGRPKRVEIVSTSGTGAVSMADSRDGGGGVEVGVVLEKPQMEVFASLFVNGLKS